MSKLYEVARISAGQGAPQGDNNYSDKGTPFIKAGNLSQLVNGENECNIQKVSETVAEKYKLKLFPKGTIVFAKSGMSCTKGWIYELQRECYVVNHLACIEPTKIFPGYLKYFFRYNQPNRLIKDESYPSISLVDISNMEIPSLPIEEQKKIAEILDKASNLISLRKKQIEKLDLLVKARFIDIFGSLGANALGWDEKLLEDIADDQDSIKCGPFGTQLSKDEYVKTGVPVWGIPQINSDFTKWPLDYVTEEKKEKLISYLIKPYDIVMSRKGNVGKCAIYPKSYPLGILHSDALRIRVNTKIVNPLFLKQQLHDSPSIEHQIGIVSSGAIMAGINVTKLKKILIHVPPIELQNQFADFVQQVEKQKEQLQQGLEKLELTYKALMQQYFN